MSRLTVIRPVLGVLCLVIAAAILVPVISALLAVGTDDKLEAKEITVAPGTYAVSLDEQVVPFTHTSATLTATSGGDSRELFLGTANGVDSESYLTGIAHQEITGWTMPGTLESRRLDGDTAPAVPPAGRDWWIQQQTGSQVSQTFDLDAAPNVIVIAPADGKGDLQGATVTMQIAVHGVLAFCIIGLAGVVLALGGALFFFLRARRTVGRRGRAGRGSGRGRSGRSDSDRAGRSGSGRSDSGRRGTGRERATPAGRGRHGATARRGLAAGSVVLGTVVGVSGCAPLPVAQPADPTIKSYSRVPLSSGQAGDFMTSYVKGLDKALQNGGKNLDALQADPLLSRTEAEILIAKAEKKKLSAGAFDSVVAGGRSFDAYPMWFMAFATVAGSDDTVEALVARRETAASDWSVVQSLFLPAASAPQLAANPAGAVAPVPGEFTDLDRGATEALLKYLQADPGKTQKEAAGIQLEGRAFGDFRSYVDKLASKSGGFKDVGVTCRSVEEAADLSAMSLSTTEGAVSLGEIRCTVEATASTNASVDMGDDVEALITGDKNRSTVVIDVALPYMLQAKGQGARPADLDDAKLSVAGDGWFMVGAKTQGKRTQG